MWNSKRFVFYLRHHLGSGHSVRVLGEPEEIHSWHEDGLRRTQEEEREGTADRLPQECDGLRVLAEPNQKTIFRTFSSVVSRLYDEEEKIPSNTSRHFGELIKAASYINLKSHSKICIEYKKSWS